MVYCYRCEECKFGFTQIVPMSDQREVENCPQCGGNSTRDFLTEHGSTVHIPGNWPMASEALGVHPDQIGEATAEAVKHGVPTDFDRHGRPIFTSPQHRKRYCEAHGYYDRNGGFSDPQRR